MNAALLALILVPGFATADTLAGLVYPPLPDGMRDLGGGCVTDERGYDHSCDYSISVIATQAGKAMAIIGARLLERDPTGNPIWLITDSVPYPDLPANFYLAMSTCRFENRKDDLIVASVRYEESKEWHGDVRQAWRFNLANEAFAPFPTNNVECANEGWGL